MKAKRCRLTKCIRIAGLPARAEYSHICLCHSFCSILSCLRLGINLFKICVLGLGYFCKNCANPTGRQTSYTQNRYLQCGKVIFWFICKKLSNLNI